jgi:hypothetical protein
MSEQNDNGQTRPDVQPATDAKTFMVTGGAGFLGINVVRHLLARGHQVLVHVEAMNDYISIARYVAENPGLPGRVHILHVPHQQYSAVVDSLADGLWKPLDKLLPASNDTDGDTTFCHRCGGELIVRDWYDLLRWNLTDDGRCKACGARCVGVFEGPPGSWGARRKTVRL